MRTYRNLMIVMCALWSVAAVTCAGVAVWSAIFGSLKETISWILITMVLSATGEGLQILKRIADEYEQEQADAS